MPGGARRTDTVCPRGDRARRIDHGGLGRGLHGDVGANHCVDPGACAGPERLHGDDTTVPVQAKGRTATGLGPVLAVALTLAFTYWREQAALSARLRMGQNTIGGAVSC